MNWTCATSRTTGKTNMAYRNGTYIAFHAQGTNLPGKSDMDYYNLMRAWSAHPDDDFTIVNSHDKSSAVRDSSKRTTLRASLLERLRNSRNMVLIIGETTKLDTDWVPFEIEQAVDSYEIPIIAAYTDYSPVLEPPKFRPLWPKALADRIDNKTARVIHVPFKKAPIMDAIGQFSQAKLPNSPLSYYALETYRGWGLAT
jgi:MTH538 TIR-like domain (DUF1863)